jgi:hypothetical protein
MAQVNPVIIVLCHNSDPWLTVLRPRLLEKTQNTVIGHTHGILIFAGFLPEELNQ